MQPDGTPPLSFGVRSQIADEKKYENEPRITGEQGAILLIIAAGIGVVIDWATKHPEQILYYWNQLNQGQ